MGKPTLLFIGPVSSCSGYGKHAADLVRSIINMNRYDVKILSLRWGNTPLNSLIKGKDDDILSRILPSPQIDKQPDILVQISVPNEFNPIGKYNIGITAGIETTVVPANFIEGMNRMNFNIVPSDFAKSAFITTAYTKNEQNTNRPIGQLKNEKPIEIVFEGCDTNIYRRLDDTRIGNLINDKMSVVKEDWAFLVVGHWLQGNIGHDRKDIGMTIKVFLEAFKNKPNAPAMVLKTSSATFSIMDRNEIMNKILQIKSTIVDAKTLPNIYLIHGQLSDIEMNELYNHPKIKSMVTLTKGEGFCVKNYTNIITDNGLKQIDSVNIGDKVLTHTGKFRNINSIMKREYDDIMYNIETYNGYFNEKVWFTPNHNILTYDIKNDEILWKEAGEINKNDYLCIPKFKNDAGQKYIYIYDYVKDIPNIILNEESNVIEYNHSDKTSRLNLIKNNKLELNAELGKLIGYYLSEGTADGNGIYFSLNVDEENTLAKEIIEIFNNLFQISTYEKIKVPGTKKLIIKFWSKIISNFLINFCGKYSHGKFINNIIFNSNDEFKSNLISSLLLGDAEITSKGISLALVNDNIIKNIRILLLEMGIISNFGIAKKDTMNKYAKIKHNFDTYRIRIVKNSSLIKILSLINKNHNFSEYIIPDIKSILRNKKSFDTNEYMIFKVKNINVETYRGSVYNIAVEQDESYCLQNFVVHNCRPLLEFSMSGKPIIASGWSGHLDFLDKELCVLLPGKLAPVDPSAVNDFILKEGQWYTADYNIAARSMIEVHKNYNRFLSNSKKLMYNNKKNFDLLSMDKKLDMVFRKYIPEFPEELSINLPSNISKIKSINLPKLKRSGV